jgi:hypothetical protein
MLDNNASEGRLKVALALSRGRPSFLKFALLHGIIAPPHLETTSTQQLIRNNTNLSIQPRYCRLFATSSPQPPYFLAVATIASSAYRI